jgi:hypothetical protein
MPPGEGGNTPDKAGTCVIASGNVSVRIGTVGGFARPLTLTR